MPFQHKSGGNSNRQTDCPTHGGIALRDTVVDQRAFDLLLLARRVLGEECVAHEQHVPLSGSICHLLFHQPAQSIQTSGHLFVWMRTKKGEGISITYLGDRLIREQAQPLHALDDLMASVQMQECSNILDECCLVLRLALHELAS